MKRSSLIFFIIVTVGLSLLLSALNLVLGDLNQDEGWYLYAARQVAEGRVLYRDFMFTQGPALPLVYSVVFPLIGKFGVAGGRLITSLLGLASSGCAAWLVFRISSKHWKKAEPSPSKFSNHRNVAALCALMLTGVNVYQSYFTTIVKTYSLCAFLLTAGFVALSYSNTRRGWMGAVLGGVLLALAACARMSAGVALPIAGIWLIVNRKKVFPFSWVAFGLGGGAVLALGLGTFFVLAPENTHFALFGYHAGRSPGGLTQLVAMKIGFVSRFVQAYFLFTAGCVVAVIFRQYHRRVREGESLDCDVRPRLTALLQRASQSESPFSHTFVSLLWLVGAGVTLVHFAAPFPYDDYQVIVFPVLAAALAATLVPLFAENNLLRVTWTVLLLSVAASFSSPINQSWMIQGRDRIWWTFKETPDLIALQQAGAEIREKLGEGGVLLTQDTYLAIEAGARVPHGMEMGPFSYYPDLSREQAEAFNLINKEMMLEMLAGSDAPVAAFSGYGLTIESPSVELISSKDWNAFRSALESNYTKCDEIENFGQAHTTLEVFEKKLKCESQILK